MEDIMTSHLFVNFLFLFQTLSLFALHKNLLEIHKNDFDSLKRLRGDTSLLVEIQVLKREQ